MRGRTKSLACESCVNFRFCCFALDAFPLVMLFGGAFRSASQVQGYLGLSLSWPFLSHVSLFPKIFGREFLRFTSEDVMCSGPGFSLGCCAARLSLWFCISGCCRSPIRGYLPKLRIRWTWIFMLPAKAGKSASSRLRPSHPRLVRWRQLQEISKIIQGKQMFEARSNVCSKPSECSSPSRNNQVRGGPWDLWLNLANIEFSRCALEAIYYLINCLFLRGLLERIKLKAVF